jgi:20S proteasome subunit beta 2
LEVFVAKSLSLSGDMPKRIAALLLTVLIRSCFVFSGDIGPSSSYFSPWDPEHHQSLQDKPSIDVSHDKFASLTKTGTTIVGLSCRDGVVLGADTRSTGGPLVMDKNKLKIHSIASLIFCCAAGTSADCDQITRKAGHHLALLRLERELCGEEASFDPIQAALISIMNSLERSVGQSSRKPSSVMILGGIDDNGPALHIIDDSMVPQRVSFAALGSGSTDAIALLETLRQQWQNKNKIPAATVPTRDIDDNRYFEDIDIGDAIKAVRQAVHAGIMNDLGSGSHIDICVIEKKGVRQWREILSSNLNDEKKLKISASAILDGDDMVKHHSIQNENISSGLGKKVFSRTKLVKYLQINGSDENIISTILEKHALNHERDRQPCDVQMM